MRSAAASRARLATVAGIVVTALVLGAAGSSGDVHPRRVVRRCYGRDVTIHGNPGDDTIVGTQFSDVIKGGQGSDVILAGGGRDFVCGNRGDDTLIGGEGLDWANGGRGGDACNAETQENCEEIGGIRP